MASGLLSDRDLTRHMRVLEPAPGVLAFYDGRVAGHRFALHDNWVDDGALSVGIASYAIVSGAEALVYDTHVSIPHARLIRRALEDRGVSDIRVVLSHWHLDHIAGNEVFADCEIIANTKTDRHMRRLKDAIESGTQDGPPAIKPLVLPSHLFESRMKLLVGDVIVELIQADIHSDDATVLWMPSTRLLFAGDTLEDTVTYVVEPEGFDRHLVDLDRLWALEPGRILPNHGHPGIIAAGGYVKTLIRATQQYIRALKRMQDDPALRTAELSDVIRGPLDAGWVRYFEVYEDVHRKNVGLVLKQAR